MSVPPEYASYLQFLPPGSKVVLVFVTLPSAVTVLPPPAGDEPETGKAPLADAVAPALTLVSVDGTRPDRRGAKGALDRLSRDWPQVRDAVRPLKQWASAIDWSARELGRAVDARAIQATTKRTGRDHGARMIAAPDLKAYLEMVVAVEHGKIAPPSWWKRVRARAA